MNFDSFPEELKLLNQWVGWKSESRGGAKSTKIPYTPTTGYHASVSKLDTWVSYNTARLFGGCYEGLGFVLTANDPYCFIDLDETADPTELALQKQIFDTIVTYAEFSPSGKGMHLICRGSVPRGIKVGSIEIYSELRYMTMTGNVYRNMPITEQSSNVNSLFAHLASKQIFRPINGHSLSEEKLAEKSDLEIYNEMIHAVNGEKAARLWAGDFATDYNGDQSRADFALINIISFFSKNHAQVKRMFRQSALGKRPKAMREDYVDNMIVASFDRLVPELDFSAIKNKLAENANKEIVRSEIKKEPDMIEKQLIMELGMRPRTINDGVFSCPPGVLGDFAKFLYDQAYKPVPEIAIAGAIAFFSGLCGRAYNVDNTGLNHYILLLAGTGRGKESINSGISKFISSVRLSMPTLGDFIGPSQLSSGQALLRNLSEHPTKSFVSIFGEFGLTIKIMANSKYANDVLLQKVILDLFNKSGASDVLGKSAYAETAKNLGTIENPAFSFIGESNPTKFYESIDDQMITTGLLPRFLIVEYLGLRPETNHSHALAIASNELMASVCNIATQVYRALQLKTPIHVGYDDTARQLDLRFDKQIDELINQSEELVISELWNRAHLKVRRLAALIAVSKNPYAPLIDVECWEWAQAFVVNSIEKLCYRFHKGQVGSVASEANQMKMAQLAIRKYLLLSEADCKAKNIPWEFRNQNIIPFRYLQQSLAKEPCFVHDFHGPATAVKRIIQILADSGDLIEIQKAQLMRQFNTSQRAFQVTLGL